MSGTTLRPKNWATFQHYKDRAPPWIKLHRALLDDYDYACLPIASKALAPLLWLLAAEATDGHFTGEVPRLAHRLRWSESDVLSGLNPLIEKGFFEVASGVLAECLQRAIPETETETEQKHSSSGDDAKVQSLEARLSEVTMDAVETWNESALVTGGLAKVRMSVGMDKRRQQVRRMLGVARDICRERFGDTRIPRKFWIGLWDQYAGDEFYSGRTAGGKGHENWRPDFKFLTHPDTVLKLYDKVCAGEATA